MPTCPSCHSHAVFVSCADVRTFHCRMCGVDWQEQRMPVHGPVAPTPPRPLAPVLSMRARE
jgi:hypothetical protein